MAEAACRAVFDGLVMLHDVTKLKLIDVKKI